MKRLFTVMFIALALLAQVMGAPVKPRVVVLTDVSTWETDDTESLVRLFVHADLFEIEGIVWTTGYSHDVTTGRTEHYNIIHSLLDAYEQDLPNLMKRSGQAGHDHDGDAQEIGYWPSADYLRNVTMWGSTTRGMQHIGEGNNSDGSQLIIDLAAEEDERPLWITVWGGGNTLAQAVWQVQQTQSEEGLKTFLNKLRVYTITDQDRHYDGSEGYEVSSHQWMRREFKDDLFFIWDECAWKFQNAAGVSNWSEYETHIQGHGSLGALYPKYKYGVEGDTPAFLHILPNGLNDPCEPGQAGWGGYSERGLCADGETSAYTNHTGNANSICTKYENRFYPATFNNFAARMDWANDGEGNQNPVVVVNGDAGLDVLTLTPKEGTTVTLDASESSDPDGDGLTFQWWIQPEAGTWSGNVTLENSDSSAVVVHVPPASNQESFHVICEVTDDGTHHLTGYRRIIFEPAENNDPRWVATWATAPYAAGNNTPPSPYLADNTLRQIIRTSIGGDTLRVKFSNRVTPTPVTINSVNIAVSPDPAKSVIDTTTMAQLFFNGNASVTMDPYTEVTCDPVAYPLAPGTHLAITIYYGQCVTSPEMTFHYGSRTYSYILEGDETGNAEFARAKKVERWYNLCSIDVMAPSQSAAVAAIGNSITDGYGIHNGDNKWPDTFSEKLLANPATSHVSVLNVGIGATQVSTSGVSRFQADVIDQSGLRWVVVFYGVNDIGADKSAETVINAFKTMINRAHAHNTRIYGATITPFKGHSYYTESRETIRQEVNEWIRTPGNFDHCIDFDEAIRNPDDIEKMQAVYSNDWLHPNKAGYQMLGESIDVNLFLGADTTFDQTELSIIESHYFEAECGIVGSNWDVLEDAGASNGKYISVQSGIQSLDAAADSEGEADFSFSLTHPSTYYVYGRLNCPTYDDDSFWVKMDDQGYEMQNGLVTSGWQWLQMGAYDLEAGDHDLTVTYREDGAKLDKLCVSSNSIIPSGLGEKAENLCVDSGISDSGRIPDDYYLSENYPNPFNPVTTIDYSIPETTHVRLTVFNTLGQEVAQVVNRVQQAGRYTVAFDGSELASNVYVYQLKAGDVVRNRKMSIIK